MTISEKQWDVLTIARNRLSLEADADFRPILKRWGGVDLIDDLSAGSYERLLDYLVVAGFRDPEYVQLVSRDYCEAICQWSFKVDLDQETYEAMLLCAEAVDGHTMSGRAFRRCMAFLERMGAPFDDMRAALTRSVMTPKQISLIHLARKEIVITDGLYRAALRDIGGGAFSAADLDHVGFRRMLVYLEVEGFVPPARQNSPAKKPSFGRRPGMATPAQVQLIRELWLEWSGADDEDALNAWLERFHGVSSLRFLTAEASGKVLTGLKAMKRRGKLLQPAAMRVEQ